MHTFCIGRKITVVHMYEVKAETPEGAKQLLDSHIHKTGGEDTDLIEYDHSKKSWSYVMLNCVGSIIKDL